jgi:hypothetical protein
MAQRFKAKTLISNSGVFNNEVIAPNLVYNTGTQIISGVKTFDSRPTVNSSGIALQNDGILTKGGFESFEVDNNNIQGYFTAKTTNRTDGNIGIEIYEDDQETRYGYSILGVRNGDGFLQSKSSNFRIETIGGGLANLNAAGATFDTEIIAPNLVYNTGDQTIAGLKTFSSGVISNVGVTGTNLVYNTGDQTIAGIKTFEVGNTANSKVIISGSKAGSYALSVVNNSNQGNVLFLKKGTNPGGGAVSENFVIKAVNRSDNLIFALKSASSGPNKGGFFCDPDDVDDVVDSDIIGNSLVISGKTYTIGEADDDFQYLVSDSNSIQGINQFYQYTGGMFFDESGFNLKFRDKSGNYPQLNPIQVTTGNDVLINGNNSFGIYQQGFGDIDSITQNLNGLGFYSSIVSGTNFPSGLKPGHLLYYTTSNYGDNNANDPGNNNKFSRIRAKARPYMVVQNASQYENSYFVNNAGSNNGNIGNFSFLKFNEQSQYSGLAIKQLIFNPTIQNAYRSYNLWSGVDIFVKPKNIHLETFIDVNIKSGNYWSKQNLGEVSYLNNIIVRKPKATNFTQAHVLNFKFNFERDDRVTIIEEYPNRVVTVYDADNVPSVTITGYDYQFSQKLRLILNTDGSLKEW